MPAARAGRARLARLVWTLREESGLRESGEAPAPCGMNARVDERVPAAELYTMTIPVSAENGTP